MEVREQPFEFSALPGRFATPLVGASAALLVGLAGLFGSAGLRWHPFAIMAGGGLFLAVAGVWLARHGVLSAPLLRELGVNLEGTRAGAPAPPTVWLCAHLDTKSQPVPSFARAAGVVLMALGYIGMLVVTAVAAFGGDPAAAYWVIAAAVTLAGAVPVVLSMVGDNSPGALDNASGVVTAIAALRELTGRDDANIGMLITDAEELGMAGARAWARGRRGGRDTILNCEGADDEGRIAVMYTGRKPAALLRAVARASRETGVVHKTSRMIPGILTDSVAFTDAGLSSVTFLRGTVRSLMRVHRASDDLAHLRGTGIADTAALVAATARQLTHGETV
jgi:hypothetical protein